MTTVLLILAALILPATMLVLTLSINEFEKNCRQLGEILEKRYSYEPMKKSNDNSKQAQGATPLIVLGTPAKT
jgi:hypothetical protein